MLGLFDALPFLIAQEAGAAAGAGAGLPNSGTALLSFLPYVLIIGAWFYFLLIRPQQKQEKQRKQMINGLKKNDKVLTGAGIYGTVLSVDGADDRVILRIDDDKGIKVAFSKASIVRVLEAVSEKDKPKTGEI